MARSGLCRTCAGRLRASTCFGMSGARCSELVFNTRTISVPYSWADLGTERICGRSELVHNDGRVGVGTIAAGAHLLLRVPRWT